MNLYRRLFEGEQLVRSREILTRFQAPRMTTTERDALKEPQEGQTILNTTLNKAQMYINSAWANLN